MIWNSVGQKWPQDSFLCANCVKACRKQTHCSLGRARHPHRRDASVSQCSIFTANYILPQVMRKWQIVRRGCVEAEFSRWAVLILHGRKMYSPVFRFTCRTATLSTKQGVMLLCAELCFNTKINKREEKEREEMHRWVQEQRDRSRDVKDSRTSRENQTH